MVPPADPVIPCGLGTAIRCARNGPAISTGVPWARSSCNFSPPPLFRQLVEPAVTGCPRGPTQGPSSPWATVDSACPTRRWHAVRPLQAGVSDLYPFWRGPSSARRRLGVAATPMRCVPCGGAPRRSGDGGGVGLAGGDVPFPSPPSRRRRAGSGLATPGARGARGSGRGLSPHEAAVVGG